MNQGFGSFRKRAVHKSFITIAVEKNLETSIISLLLEKKGFFNNLKTENKFIDSYFKICLFSAAINQSGISDLCIACRNNNLEIVKFLVEQKANLDGKKSQNLNNFLQYSSYTPPLHYSIIINSNLDVIRFLVKKGADSNVLDESQRNAFECVYHYRNEVELLYLLLANNANIKYNDNNQTSPFQNLVRTNPFFIYISI